MNLQCSQRQLCAGHALLFRLLSRVHCFFQMKIWRILISRMFNNYVVSCRHWRMSPWRPSRTSRVWRSSKASTVSPSAGWNVTHSWIELLLSLTTTPSAAAKNLRTETEVITGRFPVAFEYVPSEQDATSRHKFVGTAKSMMVKDACNWHSFHEPRPSTAKYTSLCFDVLLLSRIPKP